MQSTLIFILIAAAVCLVIILYFFNRSLSDSSDSSDSSEKDIYSETDFGTDSEVRAVFSQDWPKNKISRFGIFNFLSKNKVNQQKIKYLKEHRKHKMKSRIYHQLFEHFPSEKISFNKTPLAQLSRILTEKEQLNAKKKAKSEQRKNPFRKLEKLHQSKVDKDAKSAKNKETSSSISKLKELIKKNSR